MWVVLAVAGLIALYLYGTRSFGYWSARGVPHDPPLPFLGTDAPRYLLLRSVTDCAADVYRRYPDEPYVGYYRGATPELVLRDPDLVRQVIVNDFIFCHPRGLSPDHGTAEPLLRNLFFADGDLWRLLRQRLTPAFSSGKLRAMFPLVAERARRMQTVVNAALGSNGKKVLDARDVMGRFTTDFIGAVGFGLEADSLNKENSEFRKLGLRIFTMTVPRALTAIAKSLFPKTFKNFKYLGQELEDEVLGLVRHIIKQRNYKPSGRNDFIDLLLELRAKEKVVVESLEKPPGPDGQPALAELDLDDELMAAQAFIFFAAGFETSSSATSFTLHQLAHHPEVQAKVQADVDQWAFMEGMRMFPSTGFLLRRVAWRYTLPGTRVTLAPGTRVTVPLQALHTDPQYWEEPEVFRPERFAPEELSSRHKFVYLPFGEGPRACIGARLGQMQSLCGLAAVLSRFSVRPAAGAPRRLRVDPRSIVVQNVLGGVPLLFTRRKL
ncbi:cytochrome p450 domain-containing protein [Phthorimaea operculella]|nr:cytochrome p450 domain-containing protein [Phthorimaea operculella]